MNLSKKEGKTVFVTVGSTKFECLINRVLQSDILSVLKRHHFTKLILQVGNGVHDDEALFAFTQPNSSFKTGAEEIVKREKSGLEVVAYRYKRSIRDDMLSADLVISHAGSGSVMESLEAGKKLIVVVNETLMDNHQLELAEKMYEEGFLLYTTCAGLSEKVELINASGCQLDTYLRGDPNLFGKHLNTVMGC